MKMNTFFAVLCALLVYGFISKPNSISKDDTDPSWGRSGLTIYTDNKTGVQYVGTALGGLSVRVDLDGKPMSISSPPKEQSK